jgi:hypothetical protein
MAAPSDLLSACLDEALARAPRLVERALDQAMDSLDRQALQRAGTGEWRDLQAAARALPALRARWVAGAAAALRQAVLAPPPAPAAPTGGLRPSSLTLVDEGTLSRGIEAAKLAQLLAPLVEQALAELDPLVSAALGLPTVQPERNPLRVPVIASGLLRLMAEPAPEQPHWPALWLGAMAAPLGEDLAALYRRCAERLRAAGVQPAAYRVIAPPPGRASRAMPLPEGSGAAPLASQPMPLVSQPMPLPDGGGAPAPVVPPGGFGAWLGRALQALRGPVMRDFLGSGGRLPLQQPLDGGWYARVDAELAALEARSDDDEPAWDPRTAERHRHLPPISRPMRHVGSGSTLDARQWGRLARARQRALERTRLKREARHVGQAVGVEVVRELVDEVARDPRLLAPVREAIVALEPALGRLALQEPQFLGDAQHPARRLLEAVARRSLRHNDEFDLAFEQFLAPVRDHVRELAELPADTTAAPFAEALDDLQRQWGAQDASEAIQRQQALVALQRAEQRQALADQIAWDLGQRSDLEGAPALVQEFVFQQWALVLAQARLDARGAAPDPGGYLSVVSDLLWSVKREQALRDPARAIAVIPRVLTTLRSGLALLGQPPEQAESFFAALETLHRPVLKLRARLRKQTLATPEPEGELDERLQPAAARKPEPARNVWLAPGELQAIGYAEAGSSDMAPLKPATARDGQGPTDAEVDALIDGLLEGHHVDLFARQRWRRATLGWTSTQRSLFLFTSEGGEPHTMTRRTLHRLVANRLLRPVQDHSVVQHALDVLAQPQPQAAAA